MVISIYIDLEKRFMLHDCGDWRRTARERRFCKHVGALMLALPEDVTRGVLEGIKRQQWEFSQYTGERGSSMMAKMHFFCGFFLADLKTYRGKTMNKKYREYGYCREKFIIETFISDSYA